MHRVNERELIQDISDNGIKANHIETLIAMHKQDRDRMKHMYERYKTNIDAVPVFQHDPVKEYEDFETGGNVRRIDHYVNNKLNNSFDVEIVDTRVGYLHGIPIVYRDEDEKEAEVISSLTWWTM